MAVIAQGEANDLLNQSLGLVAFPAQTTPMKLGLFTTLGTQAAAGTEVSGGSYARLSLTGALPAGGTNGSISTNAALNFTGMPAVNGANFIVAVEVYDSAGTPKRKWFGALSANKQTSAGDTISFASGAITLTIS